eukprot:GHVU01142176.1.p1 GENE.GHVU01142176.1~~GHVU01142176.1.p1  ORF type:complete len:130 (-),score=8.43 GHVU01142176.1:243-632(-)
MAHSGEAGKSVTAYKALKHVGMGQAEERVAHLKEAVEGAAHYMDYKSHYEVSRCCREGFRSIRTHYAAYRRLPLQSFYEKTQLAAIRHVVGERAMASLEELDMGRMVPCSVWTPIVESCAATLWALVLR